jgi:hypothetical protein
MLIRNLIRIAGLLPIALLLFSTSTQSLAGFTLQETPSAVEADYSTYIPLLKNNTYPAPPQPPPQPPPTGGNIVIDHTSVALFDRIPERYITAARNLRLMFSDRSVGENISWSLDCLAAPSWEQSTSSCRKDYYNSEWDWKVYTLADLTAGRVPSRIQFDADPTRYNRSNWTFVFKQGTWSELTQDFVQNLAPAYINSKDVLTYQFSYVNVAEGDDIADSGRGFFTNNPDRYDIYDLEAYMVRYPNKTFFFWTTSLARGIGSETATTFNNQMRQYAQENDQILFDVADIQSHTDQGVACYDNRDGIQYCSQTTGECENYPNDRLNLPAICQDYTTEIDGGHLGSVSGGGIRIAKAFWVLMARIAGWDGISP